MTDEEHDSFDFYLRFAKPLVLSLPDTNERSLASAWVKKLHNEDSGSENVRKDYLKLLLFSLHRKKLTQPFLQSPEQENLKNLEGENQILELAKEIIVKEEQERVQKLQDGMGSGDFPPYTIECSADLLEYAAAQDIPKFGVHAYYAVSFEPITRWDNAEKGILPKGVIPVAFQRPAAGVSSTPAIPGDGSKSRSPKTPTSQEAPKLRPRILKSPKSTDQLRPTLRERSPPKPVESPLGSRPPTDERTPVTWGSNLIEVTDPPERDFLSPVTSATSTVSSKKSASTHSSRSGGIGFGVIPDIHLIPPTPELPPSPYTEATILPYSTPSRRQPPSPSDEAPSLPYLTPPPRRQPPSPSDEAPSLPYLTPPPRRQPPSPSDEAPSLPYRTPTPRRMEPEAAAGVQFGSPSDRAGRSPRPLQPQVVPSSSRSPHAVAGPPAISPGMSAASREIINEANQALSLPAPGERERVMVDFDTGPTSPRRPNKPVHQVFPNIRETNDPWSEGFFDLQQPELMDVDDDAAPIPEDYDTRMNRLLKEMGGTRLEAPAAVGVSTTTPRTSPTPTRTKVYGTDYPIFEEVLPEFESPVQSPASRAAEQLASLYSPPAQRQRAPPRTKTPTPPKAKTPTPPRHPEEDEFGLPRLASEQSQKPASKRGTLGDAAAPRGSTPAGSSKSLAPDERPEKDVSKTHEGGRSPLKTVDELQAIIDAQYAAIYGNLVSNEPGSPTGRRPDDIMGQVGPQSPRRSPRHILDSTIPEDGQLPRPLYPQSEIPGWTTPPETRIERPKHSPVLLPQSRPMDMLNFEYPPQDMYMHVPLTPPSPPPQVSYDEYYDSRLEQDQFVDFGAADVAALVDAHEMVPYEDRAEIHVHDMNRVVAIPTSSRTRRPRDEQPIDEEPEYTYISPVKTVTMETFDPDAYRSPEAMPQEPPVEQNVMNIMQEHFINEFEDPAQRDLMRRVVRIVEDVDDIEGEEPLMQTHDQLMQQATSELPAAEPGEDIFMASPPQDIGEVYEVDEMQVYEKVPQEMEQQPTAPSPRRQPSPQPDLQQYDFQAPVDDFMTEDRPYELPTRPQRIGGSPPQMQQSPSIFDNYQEADIFEASPPPFVSPERGYPQSPSPKVHGEEQGVLLKTHTKTTKTTTRESPRTPREPPAIIITEATYEEENSPEPYQHQYSPLENQRPLTETDQRIQDLEDQLADTQLPMQYPDDLMGVSARTPGTHGRRTLMDRTPPHAPGMPSPMKPPTVIPGWETPPELKITPTREPSPLLPYQGIRPVRPLEYEQMPQDTFMMPSVSQQRQRPTLPEDYFPLATEMPFFMNSPGAQQSPGTKKITTTTIEKSPSMTRTTTTSRTEPAGGPSNAQEWTPSPTHGYPTPSPPAPRTHSPTPPSAHIRSQVQQVDAAAAAQYAELFEASQHHVPTPSNAQEWTPSPTHGYPTPSPPAPRTHSPTPPSGHIRSQVQQVDAAAAAQYAELFEASQHHVPTPRPQPPRHAAGQTTTTTTTTVIEQTPSSRGRPQHPSIFDTLDAGPHGLQQEQMPSELVDLRSPPTPPGPSFRRHVVQEFREPEEDQWPTYEAPNDQQYNPWQSYLDADIEAYQAPQIFQGGLPMPIDPNLGLLDRVGQLVSDVELPGDFAMPPPVGSPEQRFVYQSPEWSPGLPVHGNIRPGVTDEQYPDDFAVLSPHTSRSPRAPRSPRRPSPNIFTAEALEGAEGIMDEAEVYYSPPMSPPRRASPAIYAGPPAQDPNIPLYDQYPQLIPLPSGPPMRRNMESYGPRYANMNLMDRPPPLEVSRNLPLALMDRIYDLTSPPPVDQTMDQLPQYRPYVPWLDPNVNRPYAPPPPRTSPFRSPQRQSPNLDVSPRYAQRRIQHGPPAPPRRRLFAEFDEEAAAGPHRAPVVYEEITTEEVTYGPQGPPEEDPDFRWMG